MLGQTRKQRQISSAGGRAAGKHGFIKMGVKMIYIGHFSFDERGSQRQIRHGYFSCLVQTVSAEAAANEFKELIVSLKKMEDTFRNIVTVYMEDIIEIQNIPQTAIVTRIQSSSGEFPNSISKSLPNVMAPGINAYGWAPDIEKNEINGDADEYKASRPFIKFDDTTPGAA